MRKTGKHEAQPAKKNAHSDRTNSVLLKTYFTSLLSLVLCVTMFLGTTMAWFTDEVGNSGNEIHVGNLSVGLALETAEGSVDLVQRTDTRIFGSDVVWTPGSLVTRKLILTNKGDMAFNYRLGAQLLNATTGNRIPIEGDALALAGCFEVYCKVPGPATSSPAAEPSTPITIDSIREENSGWGMVGTLADVLSGTKNICSGTVPVASDAGITPAAEGAATPAADPGQAIEIALYMKPDTPSTYINSTIQNIYIYLTAYQTDGEELTIVNNLADLAQALSSGNTSAQTIVLNSDITVSADTVLTVPADKTVTLNLNGKTLTGEVLANANDPLFQVSGNLTLESGTITVTDTYVRKIANVEDNGKLTISGGNYTTGDVAFYFTDSTACVEINGGTVTAKSISHRDGKLTVNGGTVTATDALYNGTGELTINGGTVTSGAVSHGTGTLTINGGHIIGTASQKVDGNVVKTVVVLDCTKVTITGGTFGPEENAVYKKNTVNQLTIDPEGSITVYPVSDTTTPASAGTAESQAG